MTVLKLTSIGNSTGVVIPSEMLGRLKVSEGDTLYAVETPNGYLITSLDSTAQEQVSLALEIMDKYRETLRDLAK